MYEFFPKNYFVKSWPVRYWPGTTTAIPEEILDFYFRFRDFTQDFEFSKVISKYLFYKNQSGFEFRDWEPNFSFRKFQQWFEMKEKT